MREASEEIAVYGEETVLGVVKPFIYRWVEELFQVTDGQTTVACSGRGSASLDILEDCLGIRLWYKRCTMAVVPRPFLLLV